MKRILAILLAVLAIGAVYAQDFIMVNGSEPTLDPNLATDVPSTRVYMGLFEGLVQYDPKTNLAVPGMAEKWTVSPDGLKITFNLRKAQWSDGKPVTAGDFVNSMERILNPATAAEYAYFPGMIIKGASDYNSGKGTFADVGYKALNDRTLEVTLVGPAPYAVDMFAHQAFGPIPKWCVDKNGSEWTKPGKIVTNGAYLLKEWKVQEYILLEKNPKYWDAKNVKLKSIKMLPVDNDTTAYNMFKNGEIDWQAGIAVSKIDEIKLRKDYQSSAQVGTYYLSLQLERKPLDDVRVRQALAMAIDKKAIVEKITKGGQIACDEFVPVMAGYTPQKGVAFNPEQAKKLLAEAGFPGGKGFPAFTYVYNTNEGHKAIGEFVQQSWKNILGIDCTLSNMEFKTLLDLRDTQRDFTVARNGWVGDYMDPNTMLDLFLSNSGNNCGNYKNEAYDTLLEKAATAKGADRMKMLMEAEKMLVTRDQAMIPIYHYANLDMIDLTKWDGWFNTPLGMHPWKFIRKR